MFRKLAYQRPEVLEVGSARELTLGYPNREVDDGCDCTKDKEAELLPF